MTSGLGGACNVVQTFQNRQLKSVVRAHKFYLVFVEIMVSKFYYFSLEYSVFSDIRNDFT